MPVANAAPSIPIAGKKPIPKISTGSKIIFAIHPHIILVIVTFILPTAWNIFSNVPPRIMIKVKENAITEYRIPKSITGSDDVNILKKVGIIEITPLYNFLKEMPHETL